MKLMKYTVVTILMLGQFLISKAAFSQRYININGRIELDSGVILFLEEKELDTDTLGTATIKNGTFAFKKSIDDDLKAKIVIQGYQGGIDMFLEPGINYQVHLKKAEPSIINGGQLNKSFQLYNSYAKQSAMVAKRAQNSVDSARSVGHYMTAKRLRVEGDSLVLLSRKPLDSILLANQDNSLGVYLLLNNIGEDADLPFLEKAFSNLTVSAQKTQLAKNLAYKIKLLSNLTEGSVIPDFVLNDASGQEVSLYSIKGKLKIIDFWASWCGPCRLENPNMVSLYKDFKDKGLRIISISLDEKKDRWVKAITDDKMTWDQLSSLKGWSCEVGKLFNVTAVPAIFILDEQNRLLRVNLRGEKLRDFVENYL